jgi:hypothetical protein
MSLREDYVGAEADTSTCGQGLHEEIARLEVLKKEKMMELVGEAREHITKVP